MISQNPGIGSQPMNRPQPGRSSFFQQGPQQMPPPSQHMGRPQIRRGEGYPPSNFPARPIRPAPARMGIAGISAGEDRFYKTHINIPPERGIAAVPDEMGKFLGYFSLALGLAEIVAGGSLAEWLGMEEKAPLLRIYGAREIGSGAGILTQPAARASWIWSRVAGDAVDLLTLAAGLRPDNPKRESVVAAMAVVGAVTVLDVLCASMLSAKS